MNDQPQDIFTTPQKDWAPITDLDTLLELCRESARRAVRRAVESNLPLSAQGGKVRMEDFGDEVLEYLKEPIALTLDPGGSGWKRVIARAFRDSHKIEIGRNRLLDPLWQWNVIRIAVPHEVAHILHFKICEAAKRICNEVSDRSFPQIIIWHVHFVTFKRTFHCSNFLDRRGLPHPAIQVAASSGSAPGRFSAHGRIWKELFRNAIGAHVLVKSRFAPHLEYLNVQAD